MVMVEVPRLAFLLTVNVTVDVPEPGALIDAGLKLTVTPEGSPEAVKATAESKPPEMVVVIVDLPELCLATLSAVGDALMEKLAAGAAVTVRLTVVVCVMPFPTPLTVIGYVPVAVVEATVMVMVEAPAPAAMDVGLKVTVTPVGWPVAERVTAESKPPEARIVIVDVPLLPCATEAEVGEAEMVKDDDVPARALIRLAPFGLPQPLSKS